MKRISLLLFLLLFVYNIHAQERYIATSDSVRLYVTVKGKGTPCLYIHGVPGAGSYFLEKLVGDSLEKHFQMIYLDQRGSVRSASPKDGNYSMDRMVKDFEEVRAALGIERWITLGHSFGGLLQMGYAERYPDVIAGMIMINCTLSIHESFENSWFPKACDLLNIEDRKFYLDTTVAVKTKLDSLLSQMIKKGVIWKMAFVSQADLNWMNSHISDVPRGNTDFESVAFGVEDYMKDFLDETAKMQMPVLFFYGKKD